MGAGDAAYAKVTQEIAAVKRHQVDNAMGQVTSLALADAGDRAILAALDMLIGVASQLGHKDLQLFQNLRAQALRLKDQLSIGGLCLDVLVGKTDDRLAGAVSRGLKEQKAKRKLEASAKENGPGAGTPVEKTVTQGSPQPIAASQPSFPYMSPLQGVYQVPAPIIYGQPPQWPMTQQPFPAPGPMGNGPNMPRTPFRRRVTCHACQKEGHLMRDCQLWQKLREK